MTEILPYESLPEHVRRSIEESRAHPERMVRRFRADPEPCDYCQTKGRDYTPECEANR